MESPCANCPFNKTGPGAKLRRSLRPGRMAEIKAGLLREQGFNCHKTTHETGNGSELLCAGAIAWAASRGVSLQMDRIGERLAYFAAKRAGAEPAP